MNDGVIMFLQIMGTLLCIVPALAAAYMALYRTTSFDNLMDIAFREKSFSNSQPLPRYHPHRLWRIAFIALAIIGWGYIFYGIAIQLLSWMPYDWRTEDGEWLAQQIALIVAFVAFVAFCFFLARLVEHIQKHQKLEEQAFATKAIEELWCRLLIGTPDENAFIIGYAERLLNYYVDDSKIDLDRMEQAIVLFKIIEKLNKQSRSSFNFREWFDEKFTLEFRARNSYYYCRQDLLKPSVKANELIKFLKKRTGVALRDDGRYLRSFLHQSGDDIAPPSIITDIQKVSVSGSYTKMHSAKEKTEKLIEFVLWADQAHVIDEVDEYLRNKAEWEFIQTHESKTTY